MSHRINLLGVLTALVASLPESDRTAHMHSAARGRYWFLGLGPNGQPTFGTRRTFEGLRPRERKYPEHDWEHRLFAKAVEKRRRKAERNRLYRHAFHTVAT